MEEAILQYGYLMIFLIAAVEGEAALVAGALLAQRGHLSLAGVVLASFAGTFLVAELIYHLARLKGREWFSHRAAANPRLAKVERMIERRATIFILFARFLWGIRIWIPIGAGLGGVSVRRFAVWNFAGALLWTAVIAPLGWLFGEALQTMHEDAQVIALWATAIIVIAVMASMLWRFRAED